MKIIVFDTETTGVRVTDEVLSLAMVDSEGSVLLDRLYAPQSHKEWPQAQQVHHISPQDLVGRPTILSDKQEIEALLNDEDTMLVGYNLGFDLRLLRQSGLTIHPHRTYDVMDAFAEYRKVPGTQRGKWRKFKLIECAAYFQYDWQDTKAHGALADSLATLHCYKKLAKIIGGPASNPFAGYLGLPFSRIAADELRELKKLLKLPLQKDVIYVNDQNESLPADEVTITRVLQPSGSCVLSITAGGQSHDVLADFLAEMQKTGFRKVEQPLVSRRPAPAEMAEQTSLF